MPTIGLDKLYYSKITEDASGNETYGTPVFLSRAVEANITLESYDAEHYSDDSAAFILNDFKKATISLNIDEITRQAAIDLFGESKDENGVLVSTGEDHCNPVALGFRSKRADGHYEYIWLYRVTFKNPGRNYKTKGDSIEFTTPSLDGTATVRNKLDSQNKHPWRVIVNEGDSDVPSAIISSWFNSVYEQSTLDATLSSLTIGSVSLNPTFNPLVTSYEAETSNATNTVSATATSTDATVEIKVNGTVHTSGSSVTWQSGNNTVEVKVINGTATKTYTVIVTKEE